MAITRTFYFKKHKVKIDFATQESAKKFIKEVFESDKRMVAEKERRRKKSNQIETKHAKEREKLRRETGRNKNAR